MSEKGDLGISNEAISLPPNYAHSETFTDSPPPAYQRKNGPIIRIARMVCMTVFAVTFLVGFFIVMYRWVLSSHQVKLHELRMQPFQPMSQRLQAIENEFPNELQMLPEPLIKGASLIALDIDNNKIEDNIQLKELGFDEPINIESESSTENQEDEEMIPEQDLPLSPFQPKGLLFPLQGQINKLRIPFPFGNPGMQLIQSPEEKLQMRNPFEHIFGPNGPNFPDMIKPKGNCKIQKNRKEIAPGVMTEAIIVTCEDEGELRAGEDIMMPPPPPQMQPQMQHMPFMPPGARRIEPPMSLLSTILKVLASKQREQKMKAQTEQSQQNPRVVKLIPMHNDNRPILPPLPFPVRGEAQELPTPINGQQPPSFPFMNLIPFAKIEVRRPQHENEDNSNDAELFHGQEPFHPRMHFRGPFPFGAPEVPRHQERQQEEEFNPFEHRLPFGPNIKVIRINRPPNFNNDHDGNNNMKPFPFNPFNPVMKLLPARQGRVIRLRRPVEGEQNQGPPPFPFPMIFPQQDEHHEGPFPHPMPEASGRALPDPVALPGMKMLRLPFRPPTDFPLDPRITHMEMKRAPTFLDDVMPDIPDSFFDRTRSFKLSPFQEIISGPHADHDMFSEQREERRIPIFMPNQVPNFQEIEQILARENEREYLQQDIEDFGPPRFHTLMDQPSHPIFIGEEEGNQELAQEDPNYHTHADGISHSHLHRGPHTHINGQIIPIRPDFTQIHGSNFHNHEDGSHSHPFDGPHTHNNGEIMFIEPDFEPNHQSNIHTHGDGITHSHPFDGPHTHENGQIVPIGPHFEPNDDTNFHTHEDGVSHSHPFDGPHTHIDGQIFPFRPAEPQINFDFHTHQDGSTHSDHHEEPYLQNEEEQMEPINPFAIEQNDNFPNEENFFISDSSFDNTQEFPIIEPEQLENQEPNINIFEHYPDTFDHQSVFDEQPQIVELQPAIPEDPQPEETIFQGEEPNFPSEEPQFYPEEPLPEEQMSQPQNTNLQEEDIPLLVLDPLFRPLTPIEKEIMRHMNLPSVPDIEVPEQPSVQDDEVPEQQDYQLDQRGYAPEGLIAPIPPPVEQQAEMIEPETVTAVEPEIMIK